MEIERTEENLKYYERERGRREESSLLPSLFLEFKSEKEIKRASSGTVRTCEMVVHWALRSGVVADEGVLDNAITACGREGEGERESGKACGQSEE